jgi:hypothetical protein
VGASAESAAPVAVCLRNSRRVIGLMWPPCAMTACV